ncbi:MAG: hypothetical protein WBG71_08965 [Leeuwenhoekiella sp.]
MNKLAIVVITLTVVIIILAFTGILPGLTHMAKIALVVFLILMIVLFIASRKIF